MLGLKGFHCYFLWFSVRLVRDVQHWLLHQNLWDITIPHMFPVDSWPDSLWHNWSNRISRVKAGENEATEGSSQFATERWNSQRVTVSQAPCHFQAFINSLATRIARNFSSENNQSAGSALLCCKKKPLQVISTSIEQENVGKKGVNIFSSVTVWGSCK